MGIYTAKEIEIINNYPDPITARHVLAFFKKNIKEAYNKSKELKLFPSFILALDHLIGGLPNHITQIYGWESTFKTTILLYIANKYKETAVFLNADNKPFHNSKYSDLALLQTDNKSNDYLKELIKFNVTDTIFIDSLAALTRYDNVFKSIVNEMYNEDLKLIFSNQTRSNKHGENVPFGPDFIHSISHTILAVSEAKPTIYGYRILLKIVKPFKANLLIPIHIDLDFNLNNSFYLIDLAVKNGIVKPSGPYYKFLDKNYKLLDLIKNTEIIKQIWNTTFNGTNFRELYPRYLE